jgi:hypothetical protein
MPRPFKAMRTPVDLGCRASPVLVFELGPIAFRKLAVEICVVRNNDVGIGHKGRDGGSVAPLAGNHLIRNAGKGSDFRRYRIGWLVQ